MADDAEPTVAAPVPATAPTPASATSAVSTARRLVNWPSATLVYEFFYTWADEVGDCCGPGTESVQAAISPFEVRLLCLRCKKTRVGRSHPTKIII